MALNRRQAGDLQPADGLIDERVMQQAVRVEDQLAKSLEMVGHLMRSYKEVREQCAAQSVELQQLKFKEQSFCGNQFQQLQHVLAKLRQTEEEKSVFCDRIMELELANERLSNESSSYYRAIMACRDSEEQLQQLGQLNRGLERQNAGLRAELQEAKGYLNELKNLQARVEEISRENSALQVYVAAKQEHSCLVAQDVRCIFAVQKPFNQFAVASLLEKAQDAQLCEARNEEVQKAFELVKHASFAQLHHAISARYNELGLLEKQILRDAGIFP